MGVRGGVFGLSEPRPVTNDDGVVNPERTLKPRGEPCELVALRPLDEGVPVPEGTRHPRGERPFGLPDPEPLEVGEGVEDGTSNLAMAFDLRTAPDGGRVGHWERAGNV